MSSADYITTAFTFGRVAPFPAIYPENKTPVTVDVLEVGWIVAFVTGYISFVLLLPAVVGKEKALYFVRITLTSILGLVIMLCNFGQEWEVGVLQSKMFYKSGSSEEIDGEIGIKLGLRSVNITLYAKPELLTGDLVGERIDYNERFYWAWEQGRRGFGPFAGQIQQDFRAAQLRGTPYPILWVAEYFTLDGEGLRFGRHYRHAGWYAHICVWAAFVCWLLSFILFKIYIRYGAIMLSILGCFLLIASLIWCSIRNFIELSVVFNNDDVKGVLRTKFGVHWYLALVAGIVCILCGIIITVLDIYFHESCCKFFGVDPYAIIDEHYGEGEEEVEELADKSSGMEMKQRTANEGEKRKTVVYKARGAKKHWTNATTETISDNNEYFEAVQAPTMDPNYLHIGYYDPNMYHPSAHQNYTYQPTQIHGGIQQPNLQQGDAIDSNELHQNQDGHVHPQPYYHREETPMLHVPGSFDNQTMDYFEGGDQFIGQVENMAPQLQPNQSYDLNQDQLQQQLQYQIQQQHVQHFMPQEFQNPQMSYDDDVPPPRPPKSY